MASGESFIISENITRSIILGPRVAIANTDFELIYQNEGRAVILVRDSNDSKNKNLEAQLIGSMIAMAQSQLHTDKDPIIRGAIIIDYSIRFYEAQISKKFMQELGTGNLPVNRPQFQQWQLNSAQNTFSMLQATDRENILKMFKNCVIY